MRSPIIFDASVVFNFGHRSGGHGESVLRQLGAEHELVIPHEVHIETLRDARDDFDYPTFLQTHFAMKLVASHSYDERLKSLSKKLGGGELAVISLSLHGAGTAAIDEKLARREAKTLNVPVVGTIGLLQEAVTQKRVDGNLALEIVQTVIQFGGRLPNPHEAKTWSEYWESVQILFA